MQAAAKAQAMSDDSGETYTLTLGVTGVVAMGFRSGVAGEVKRFVGYAEIERSRNDPIIDALRYVRHQLRYGREEPQ